MSEWNERNLKPGAPEAAGTVEDRAEAAQPGATDTQASLSGAAEAQQSAPEVWTDDRENAPREAQPSGTAEKRERPAGGPPVFQKLEDRMKRCSCLASMSIPKGY